MISIKWQYCIEGACSNGYFMDIHPYLYAGLISCLLFFLQVSLPIYFSQSPYNIFCICFGSFLVSIIDWRWQEMWHFIWYPTEIGMLRDDTKNGCVADYFCNGSQSIQNRKNQLPFHQTGSAACVLGVFWASETALFMFVLFPLLLWSFKMALPRAKEEKQALKARCVRVSTCARVGAADMSRTLTLNDAVDIIPWDPWELFQPEARFISS